LTLPALVDPVLSQQHDDHGQESNCLLFKYGWRLLGIINEPHGQLLKLFRKQPHLDSDELPQQVGAADADAIELINGALRRCGFAYGGGLTRAPRLPN
jgi:hypothetical protein